VPHPRAIAARKACGNRPTRGNLLHGTGIATTVFVEHLTGTEPLKEAIDATPSSPRCRPAGMVLSPDFNAAARVARKLNA
jgi:hypothetical protein